MIYTSLPTNETHDLSFYLAMEEFIARNLNDDEYFFMWQVQPTVIFGRNQLIENEVNLDYVKKNDIKTFRRKSGGGCVYADYSNIMFSYIANNINVSFTFDAYLTRITEALQKLGINAIASGRNDITIDEKKISGNAFYRVNGKSVVHGTMLFNTDLENLVLSITPNNQKLISKGIESVRKRVTNLSEHLNIGIEEFKNFMRKELCDSEIELKEQDITAIKEIEREYTSNEFIYGNNPRYSIIKKGYVNAGDIEIRLELKNNQIKDINIVGDYFLVGDINEGIIDNLKNTDYNPASVAEKLKSINIEDYIHNLTKYDFFKILFQN